MAFNEKLAARVRVALCNVDGVTEKRMFGGVAFMRDGSMLVGVDKDDLIVRCAKEDTHEHLKRSGVREFDLSGGRPMKGWLLVGPTATKTEQGFGEWIAFALAGKSGTQEKARSTKVRSAKTATRGAKNG